MGVHRTGNPAAYAATLLKITELKRSGNELALATGILGRKSHFAHRIEELLSLGRRFAPAASRPRLVVSVFFVSALCFGAMLSPGLVQVRRVATRTVPRTNFAPADKGFLAGLKDAGYTHLDVDEIIQLKQNGVNPKYIAEISGMLGKISVQQLVQLRNQGVNAVNVRKAKELLKNPTVEQIIKFKTSGAL